MKVPRSTELLGAWTSRKDEKRKYFNAAITDGKNTMRMVSFDPSLRGDLDKLSRGTDGEDDSAVTLMNCVVKKSNFSRSSDGPDDPQYEILLTSRTKVIKSPKKKFKVSQNDLYSLMPESKAATTVSISDLSLLAVNNRVTLSAKALFVGQTDTVITKDGQRKLQKQECIIGDDGGSCRVVLWEKDIGKLELNKSYHLENVIVRMFNTFQYPRTAH